MERDESSATSFPMGETAQEKGFSHVPQCCTIPTSDRPSINPDTEIVQVVDWAALDNPDQRSETINQIKNACSRSGCFQVTTNPPEYREEMGKLATELNKIAAELMKAITESLGLGPTNLSHKMENGMQVMVINCYPPCPEPSLSLVDDKHPKGYKESSFMDFQNNIAEGSFIETLKLKN